MLLQLSPYNTSYLYHYEMQSWYSSTITPVLFHCMVYFPQHN